MIDWNSLEEVYDLARRASVDFAVNYCDCDDSWYCTVSSPAPAECYIGKNRSFKFAVECVIKHLTKLNVENLS
jgi:hypothetical protein